MKVTDQRRNLLPSVGLVLLVALAGCSASRRNTDTSALVIEPGRGIPGICELGMSLSQLEHVTPVVVPRVRGDAWWRRDRWDGGRPGIAPALGAIAGFEPDKRIRFIIFYVQPYKDTDTPAGAFSIDHPFKGSVRGGPSFAAIPVTKQQVEACLGRLPSLTFAEAFRGGHLTNGSVCTTSKGGWEELRYRDKGIEFIVRSNSVAAIVIEGGIQPKTMGNP